MDDEDTPALSVGPAVGSITQLTDEDCKPPPKRPMGFLWFKKTRKRKPKPTPSDETS